MRERRGQGRRQERGEGEEHGDLQVETRGRSHQPQALAQVANATVKARDHVPTTKPFYQLSLKWSDRASSKGMI